ncbi:PAS domain S-box protein [Salinimicrobium sp. HB62]|uniref:PAS domain S-box protein n=1 Tax=Salinimicrobium sp. HB62 TaxID=3077781 RepID=UPI002D79BEDF|nr:PAS domain S-box protein [Salinimicrobium sp. HB62]
MEIKSINKKTSVYPTLPFNYKNPEKKEQWNVFQILLQDKKLFDAVQNRALQGYVLFYPNNPEDKWLSPTLYQTLDLINKPNEVYQWSKIVDNEDMKVLDDLLKLQNYRNRECYGIIRLRHSRGYVITMDYSSYYTKDEAGEDLIVLAFRRKHFRPGETCELDFDRERTENDRINREIFEGSFKNAAIGMALLDPTGRWLEVNTRLCEIVGYQPEELRELTFQDITHPDDLEADLSLLKELVEGKRGHYQMEKRYFHKNGSIIHIILSVSLVRNSVGEPLYFISQITDVTSLKETQKALGKALDDLENILEASSRVSIIGFDRKGVISSFNKGAENLLEYSKEDVIGKLPYAILHLEQEIEERKQELENFTNKSCEPADILKFLADHGLPHTKEWKFRTNSGKLIPVQVTITPIKKNNQITGYLSVATDIKELKRAQKEIASILHITQEQNDRLKNFANIVSHNLRNHSANFKNLLNLYLDEVPEQGGNEMVQMLLLASGQLEETVFDLEKIVTSNKSTYEDLESLNLHSAVEKAVSSVHPVLSETGTSITNDTPKHLEVIALPAYLDSIILNLITNAIKYRENSRKSFIRFSAVQDAGKVVMKIEDNGKGIDLQKFGDKIFGMYKTFHGNEDARGIGLFITKNQVETMGGRISVSSEVGKGTVFEVILKQEK